MLVNSIQVHYRIGSLEINKSWRINKSIVHYRIGSLENVKTLVA